MSVCIDDVACWMSSNRLQLNAAKTEFLWCSAAWRQNQLPTLPFRVCKDFVTPSAAVRDLGICLDSDVKVDVQVSRTVSHCFSILRRLRSIRRSLSSSVFQSLVASSVLSRLNYGNATLAGITSLQLRRLQSVMNAAARLVFSASRSDHVTPLLRRLHWLRAPERIVYKLAVLAYQCLHGLAPAYLADVLLPVTDLPGRRRLCSSSTSAVVVDSTCLRTIDDRAFPAAASRTRNSLPPEVTSLSLENTINIQICTEDLSVFSFFS